MADGQDPGVWSGLPDGSLGRRTVLKFAGFVPVLSGGAAAQTTGEAGTDDTPPAGHLATADSTTAEDDSLGRPAAVGLGGKTAIVGAPPGPGTAESVGRAVVLARSRGGWTRRTTLSPDDDSGQFGSAVALDGDTAVVGAELGSDPAGGLAGSAAVFTRNGGAWQRQTTLRAPDPSGVDLFGTAVDVAGDTVLVGASGATAGDGRDSGAAFVYARSGDSWRRTANLVPSGEGTTDFGRAVALDGDTAAVGARRAGLEPGDSGVVFVFGRRGGGWHEQAELVAGGDDRNDGFGTALAAAGGRVLVGAPAETNDVGTAAGGAYVFARRNGRWRREATLRDDSGSGNHRFGAAVALDGEVALVGTGLGRGPIVFGRSEGGWAQEKTLRTDGDGAPVVALDGLRAVVGTGGRPDLEGSVEVFEP